MSSWQLGEGNTNIVDGAQTHSPDVPKTMVKRVKTIPGPADDGAESCISGLVTRSLLIGMEQMGVDTEALCARRQIDHKLVMNAASRVPNGVLWMIFNEGARTTGDPSFGLAIAQTPQGRAAGGILRQMAEVSETAEAAVMRLVQFHKIIADGLRIDVQRDDATMRLEFIPADPDVDLIRHAMECFFATIWLAISESAMRPFSPLCVEFPHAAPPNERSYEAVFGCPVGFSAKRYRLDFPIEPLRQEMIGARSGVVKRLTEVAENELRAIVPEFVANVGARVRVALEQRRRPTRANIAKDMGIGERTLGRRLEQEGSSFRAVIDDTRRRLAISMLRDGDHSVSDIADATGFEDANSFAKAFRRWTGKSPSSYTAG